MSTSAHLGLTRAFVRALDAGHVRDVAQARPSKQAPFAAQGYPPAKSAAFMQAAFDGCWRTQFTDVQTLLLAFGCGVLEQALQFGLLVAPRWTQVRHVISLSFVLLWFRLFLARCPAMPPVLVLSSSYLHAGGARQRPPSCPRADFSPPAHSVPSRVRSGGKRFARSFPVEQGCLQRSQLAGAARSDRRVRRLCCGLRYQTPQP